MSHGPLISAAIAFLGAFPLAAFGQQTPADAPDKVHLIAHRGGVVDEQRIENNLPALQAAIDRGYWMVEADIRETGDGHVIVHHNDNFRLYYKDPRKPDDLTWDEIRRLRSQPGDLRPLEFHEYAAACKGKIRVMLDMKGPDHPRAYYEKVEAALRENNLLDSALVIGTTEAKDYFKSRARVSVSREELRAAIDKGEDVGKLYFLFEHARHLDADIIETARKVNVPVVVSINTFHYPKDQHMERAEQDIRRLKQLGVRHFQIDSVYDRWLRE